MPATHQYFYRQKTLGIFAQCDKSAEQVNITNNGGGSLKKKSIYCWSIIQNLCRLRQSRSISLLTTPITVEVVFGKVDVIICDIVLTADPQNIP